MAIDFINKVSNRIEFVGEENKSIVRETGFPVKESEFWEKPHIGLKPFNKLGQENLWSCFIVSGLERNAKCSFLTIFMLNSTLVILSFTLFNYFPSCQTACNDFQQRLLEKVVELFISSVSYLFL